MFKFEIAILKALEAIRTPFLDFLFKYLSWIGKAEFVFALFLIIYYIFNKKMAYKLMYMASTAICTNNVVKSLVKIERPFSANRVDTVSCVDVETATGYSFPSGHSQTVSNYTFGFAMQFKKIWMYILAGIVSLIVAFSRMYMGCHFLSDVVVGLIEGILIAYLCNHFSDKYGIKKCMVITALIFIPFLVYFMFSPTELYADLYKGYGFLVGGLFAYIFDEKVTKYEVEGKLWKRIIKMVIAAVIALGIKSGLKVLFGLFNAPLQVSLILDMIRYIAVVFVSVGLCPYIFKKLKF